MARAAGAPEVFVGTIGRDALRAYGHVYIGGYYLRFVILQVIVSYCAHISSYCVHLS